MSRLAGHTREQNHCPCARFQHGVDCPRGPPRMLFVICCIDGASSTSKTTYVGKRVYHNLLQELRLEDKYGQAPIRNLEDTHVNNDDITDTHGNRYPCENDKHTDLKCYIYSKIIITEIYMIILLGPLGYRLLPCSIRRFPHGAHRPLPLPTKCRLCELDR